MSDMSRNLAVCRALRQVSPCTAPQSTQVNTAITSVVSAGRRGGIYSSALRGIAAKLQAASPSYCIVLQFCDRSFVHEVAAC